MFARSVAFAAVLSFLWTTWGAAEEGASKQLPYYLEDRGIGTPTSMFGIYVEHGEILIYPFFEYYLNKDQEYAPNEFGYTLDEDYFGEYRASEGLIFLCYGLTRDIALELEVAAIKASLETAPEDPTDIPDKIEESGLGDVQTQIDWRFLRETDSRPAAFSYFEVVYPLNKDKLLIGTQDWEFKLGAGLIRGFHWGTTTLRLAVEYDRAENKVELGEIALEYLKRLSRHWRWYTGVEGVQDEVELILEAQLFAGRHVLFKFNTAFGLTPKATDWGPELGVMFIIPTR